MISKILELKTEIFLDMIEKIQQEFLIFWLSLLIMMKRKQKYLLVT